MKHELLLLPDKPDVERDSIANTWIKNGGEVLQIQKFWEKPQTESKRITIYGNDSFSLVLAQVVGVSLVQPKDEIITELDDKWIKRVIKLMCVEDAIGFKYPTFIKPVKPKTFKAQVYNSYNDFKKETSGISFTEQIIQSGLISIEKEVRAFILHNQILDMAFYEGSGNIHEAKFFLTSFLADTNLSLPKTFVIDLGYNELDGWFIIEFNSCWGAGLNFCNPDKVINCIREATIN
jgi:hypothetical protein